jgi:hypothetical protein
MPRIRAARPHEAGPRQAIGAASLDDPFIDAGTPLASRHIKEAAFPVTSKEMRMAGERKKKDGQDPGKKRRRMREDVARRRAEAAPDERSSDQPDIVRYKQGSASDRNRRGA